MRGDEHYVPWENYPKFLLFNEIRDPYRALRDAFWGEEPEKNKRLLEQLKTFALSDTHYQGGKEGPAKMVQAVNEWVRMIEICYILWLDRKTPDDWDRAELVEGWQLNLPKIPGNIFQMTCHFTKSGIHILSLDESSAISACRTSVTILITGFMQP